MAYESTRISYTDPSPYDQAFVISQGVVNEAFGFLHDNSKDTDAIRYYKQNIRVESIEMNLDAPAIEIQAIGNDPQVYLMIYISSGTLQVYQSDGGDDLAKYDLTGWKLAYPVKFDSTEIPGTDQIYTDKGVDPNVYTLVRSFLTHATSSTQINDSMSSYGDGEIKKNEDGYVTFKVFLGKWLAQMEKENSTVLGYGKKANRVGDDKTTYPPTDINYSIYPWKGETGGDAVENNQDQNSLTYLMMSDWRHPPAKVGLPYSGPFTNGTAAYCMNKTTYWDSWILPILNAINQGTDIIPTEPELKYDAKKWVQGLRMQVGGNPDHLDPNDPYYNFNKDGPNSWTWRGRALGSQKTVKHEADSVTVTETSTSSATISFAQGSNVMTIKGTNTFKYQAKLGNEANPTYQTFQTTWTLLFKIHAVTDGGLQITKVSAGKPASKLIASHKGSLDYVDKPDVLQAEFSSGIATFLNDGTKDIENQILNALTKQNELVLPASGVFHMINPLFNSRGDLLVDLWYYGSSDTNPGREGGSSTKKFDVTSSISTPEGVSKVSEVLAKRLERLVSI